MKYTSFSEYLKSTYGCKVYKLSLQSGCSCPNRDGKLGTGGCTFCSEGGSGDFAAPLLDISKQIEAAKALVDSKFSNKIKPEDRKYIAYFQSYTNTYGDKERLLPLYMDAISRPEIVALSIGTRPDCLQPEILDMLSTLNRIKPVYVELGLQTSSDETAKHIHRGYPTSVFTESYNKLKSLGLMVVIHVILGLPGEDEAMMCDTIRYVSSLSPAPDGIKLQLLHVLKGTQLEKEYEETHFHIMSLDEYCKLVVKCLKLLPAETVVHRITGDGPKRLLIEPKWSADKKKVLNTLTHYISEA